MPLLASPGHSGAFSAILIFLSPVVILLIEGDFDEASTRRHLGR
jgi:hypothetical protein